MKCFRIILLLSLLDFTALAQTNKNNYVNPLIGSEGEGNVFIGPTLPFGMVKPGPDCDYNSNSGYSPLNKNKSMFGISHTHVSGTGGEPKYGNLLVAAIKEINFSDTIKLKRIKETVSLGKYEVFIENPSVNHSIACTHSTTIHRFIFNKSKSNYIKIDLGHHLGKSESEEGENQKLVGCEMEILPNGELRGYSKVKGGWNKGAAYTVYFHAIFKQKSTQIYPSTPTLNTSNYKVMIDNGVPHKLIASFDEDTVDLKLAISFVSASKALENLNKEMPNWDLEATVRDAKNTWNKILSKFELEGKDINRQTAFYTSIYHTCIIPSDRTGENPHWRSKGSYYDDFYAIWDTYRTSFPLLTLLVPDRVSGMINSLLDTYKNTGFIPDARSGNDNGLTQGGSNTDIVIADAFVKGLKNIDYQFALKGMLHNAKADPGVFHRKIGRGGITEYNSLGYVPYHHERHATRTVEYSLCDFAIAQLAKGLGKDSLARKFYKQSTNWKNLWRDTLIGGTKGFIWPKDASGKWIDSTYQVYWSNKTYKFERSKKIFVPESFGWGWNDVFYEGNSHHYSLQAIHDPASMVSLSGGKEMFEARLDSFFTKGHYDVTNEPCFFTPVLYHYIGKPYKSIAISKKIINSKFGANPSGIPGNDDSGAMSSWYAFHSIGLYPNAGQDVYLITVPSFEEIKLNLPNGKELLFKTKGFSEENIYIKRVLKNGKPFDQSWITHQELMEGGTYIFEMTNKPSNWGCSNLPPNGLVE